MRKGGIKDRRMGMRMIPPRITLRMFSFVLICVVKAYALIVSSQD